MPPALPIRKFIVSFPEDLAQKVDQLAQQESRDTSELFCEAFRTYFAHQLRARMEQTRQLAASGPKYKKSETRRLLEEARQEMKTAEKE